MWKEHSFRDLRKYPYHTRYWDVRLSFRSSENFIALRFWPYSPKVPNPLDIHDNFSPSIMANASQLRDMLTVCTAKATAIKMLKIHILRNPWPFRSDFISTTLLCKLLKSVIPFNSRQLNNDKLIIICHLPKPHI